MNDEGCMHLSWVSGPTFLLSVVMMRKERSSVLGSGTLPPPNHLVICTGTDPHLLPSSISSRPSRPRSFIARYAIALGRGHVQSSRPIILLRYTVLRALFLRVAKRRHGSNPCLPRQRATLGAVDTKLLDTPTGACSSTISAGSH